MEAEKFDLLLRRIDDGDERAFEIIYREYAKKIKLVAISILQDSRYADEVLDNVMIAIWNKSAKLKHIVCPDAFIHKMAKNASIDIYNHLKRRAKRELNNLDVLEPTHLDSYKSDFNSYVECLDEAERDIVIKRIVFGYAFREIAEELKIPESTLKCQYGVILEKIKKHLNSFD